MGDLDGDNDLDIVAGVAFTDEVVWYENINNNGFFGEAQVLSNEADNVDALEPMDIDGDDDLDIVFIEGFDGEVGYFENTDGQGNFADLFIFSNDIDYTVY